MFSLFYHTDYADTSLLLQADRGMQSIGYCDMAPYVSECGLCTREATMTGK